MKYIIEMTISNENFMVNILYRVESVNRLNFSSIALKKKKKIRHIWQDFKSSFKKKTCLYQII